MEDQHERETGDRHVSVGRVNAALAICLECTLERIESAAESVIDGQPLYGMRGDPTAAAQDLAAFVQALESRRQSALLGQVVEVLGPLVHHLQRVMPPVSPGDLELLREGLVPQPIGRDDGTAPVHPDLEEAQALARRMHEGFYPDFEGFEPLDTVGGCLSQISNMLTGLCRAPELPAVTGSDQPAQHAGRRLLDEVVIPPADEQPGTHYDRCPTCAKLYDVAIGHGCGEESS